MKVYFQGCFFHTLFQGYKYIKGFISTRIWALYKVDFKKGVIILVAVGSYKCGKG
nr:MAG TPA: hypothetical protein [Caudoviricetes sp.]